MRNTHWITTGLLAALTACGGQSGNDARGAASDADATDEPTSSAATTASTQDDTDTGSTDARASGSEGSDIGALDDATSDDAMSSLPNDDSATSDDAAASDDTSGLDDSVSDDTSVDEAAASDDAATNDDPPNGSSPAVDDGMGEPFMPPIFGEPEPEPPPPSPLPRADCEETYNQVNDENSFCSLRYECDDDELEAQCTWRDDHWDCICEGLQFRDSYELVGVETTTACGVIVDLCFSGTATAFDGPEQCVDTLDLEADSCELLRDCKASADLGGGVVASQVISTDYNRCSGDETSLSCSCQVGGFGGGVTLTGASSDAACELLFDVCGSDSVANFSPAGECTRSHRRSEDTVCEASESCTLQSAVGSGVSAEVNTNHNINCHDVGEEDWECRCNGAGTATFSWTVAATSEETCNGALDVCAMASALPQTEPTDLHVDCEDNARVTGGNNCGHTDLCSVEVDVAGVEVNVENFVYTNCYQTGEGEFACSCSSWVTQAAFEHTSAASLRDVCAEVAPTCNSMANIRLDPY